MGRGYGGYVEKSNLYRDTSKHKVTDKGVIYVAERYIDAGYCVVFIKQQSGKNNVKKFDLAIKSYDDSAILERIEVKRITSDKPYQTAAEIARGFEKFNNGYVGSVDLFYPNLSYSVDTCRFIQQCLNMANDDINGPIRVWLGDGTILDYPYNGGILVNV